jgi:translocation protein SEC63
MPSISAVSLFTSPKDKKAAPVVLLGLVGCGILLPLIGVSVYMMNTNKFAGPNHIMQETLAFYFNSKFSIKESQV